MLELTQFVSAVLWICTAVGVRCNVDHILLYKWTEHWRLVYRYQHHTWPTTQYRIKVTYFKLIDLLTRIELPLAILMPRFSIFFRNSTLHFRTFLDLVTCFLRVTVSLPCQSEGLTFSFPFTNKLAINWNMYLWYCL